MPSEENSKKDDKMSLDSSSKDGASAPLPEALKAASSDEIIEKVAGKINAADNILVALSKDPSVDEISAAIGLTMILNQVGKHVTAIYSGETPNTLEFLNPDQTFEKDTHSLQDFIIALNKDKADHLRYKIEGDFVKVYITPYKTTITDKDLEFSQGDFNVDLVVAIDVDSGESIDNALAEYGRIMHDATAVNITTNASGHFAELEWSDPSISSVCEMIARLAEKLGVNEFNQSTATALLTGIVAATERFSNARTTSDTMALSSKLMQAGADQQLISNNIMTPAAAAPAAPEQPAAPAPAAPVAPAAPAPAPAAPAAPLIPEPSLVAPETLAQPAPAPAAPAAPLPTLLEQAAMPAPAAPAPAPAPAPEAPTMNIPAAPAAEPEILVGTPAPKPSSPPPSLEPAGAEGLATPSSPIQTEPIQKNAAPSDTMSLPGYSNTDDVQAAMNEILNPGANAAPATEEVKMPSIISQGSVMSQNVAEPVAPAPDYGSMIDQALSEGTQPLSNPAMAAAPQVPGQAPEAATIPNVYVDPNANMAAPAMAPMPEMPSVPQGMPEMPPEMAPMPEIPAQDMPAMPQDMSTMPPAMPQDMAPAPDMATMPPAMPEMPGMPPAMPEMPGMPPAPAAPEVPIQPVDVPQDMNIELPPPPAPEIDASAFQIPNSAA